MQSTVQGYFFPHTILLTLLTNLPRNQVLYQLNAPLPQLSKFMVSPFTHSFGLVFGSSLLLRPTSKQQPILYRTSGSSFLFPCLYLLFVTGLLLLVSLMPGYHSNTWVSWYHCTHPKLYVIPIVCIISPELPSVTLKDLCLSHPTTY